MLARNALLIFVVLTIAVVFVVSVFPSAQARQWREGFDPQVVASDGFTETVDAVDAAFAQRWRDLEVHPSPRADDLIIARRISLALTGAIPSLEEIRLFEEQAPEQRLAWWTDGLLRDRRYADYMAERLARAYVGVENGPFLIYRRRRFVSWLADELHEDRPYNRIVQELIAGDGLWTNEPATNFITVTITPGQEGQGPDETKLAARVARAFLGVRIDCAECHDHPFDVWKQQDFHQLAAFFGRTENSFTGIREARSGEYEMEDAVSEEKQVVEPAVPFAEELLGGGNNRRRLAQWVTHAENPAFARATVNRVWALMFGRALHEPIDNIPLGEEAHPALAILADDFVRHDYNLRRLIQLIAASEAFQVDSIEPEDLSQQQIDDAVAHGAVFPLTRLRPDQVVGALLQACSVQTIDYESHVFIRLVKATGQQQFVQRYGDAGEDEFGAHGGTIPQRLLMLNGNIVKEKTGGNPAANAAAQIAMLAPTDDEAVECAYLAVFTRRPTAAERQLFIPRLEGKTGNQRMRAMEDIFATLLNSTEFSWSH